MEASINTEMSLFLFAEFHDSIPLNHIAQKCLQLIQMQPQLSAFDHSHWTKLDREAVRKILLSDVINCDEYTLFAALLEWLKAKHPNISKKQLKLMANDLENCIRWSTLSMDEFERIITLAPEFFSEEEKTDMKQTIGNEGTSVIVKRRFWFWNRKIQIIHIIY